MVPHEQVWGWGQGGGTEQEGEQQGWERDLFYIISTFKLWWIAIDLIYKKKKKKKEKTFLQKEEKAHPATVSDDGSEWVSSASRSPEGLGYKKMGLDSDRASGRGKEDGIKRFSGGWINKTWSVTDTAGTEKRTSPSLFFHPLQSPARSPNQASFQFFSDILVGWLFCHSVSGLALSPPETGQQLLGLTLMPSIRKPRVDVELTVSLHCM